MCRTERSKFAAANVPVPRRVSLGKSCHFCHLTYSTPKRAFALKRLVKWLCEL